MRKPPKRGYLEKCPVCGENVVHGTSTKLPLHRHGRSKKCAILGARRAYQAQAFPKVERTPGIISGEPRLSGTRMPVATIQRVALYAVQAEYPHLTDQQIITALQHEWLPQEEFEG
jgi:uncharacterized protein (DUF433 family)